jgi:hypothetical protein
MGRPDRSRRDEWIIALPSLTTLRKAKAIAEVLAMIANAQAPLAPHRPRPVLEADERLFETAPNFARL